LRLRHGTTREIVAALANRAEGRNPTTGEPWDHTTIHRDIKALEKQWREVAHERIDKHKATHLAELREVRRAAWQANNGPKLFYVLKSLEQEARILGLEYTEEQGNADTAIRNFAAGAEAYRKITEERNQNSVN
jgi:hypothetical protein